MSRRWLLAVAVLASATQLAVAAPDWALDATQRAALQRGEVVVVANESADSSEARRAAVVRAAVRINAPAARVFSEMTDCKAALQYVPKMKRCVVLETSADGRSQVVEHEVDYGWFMPSVSYVFRADYVPNRSIDFRHLRGDFRENSGRWELTSDGAEATILTYRVRMVPAFRVPQWLVRASLKRELPELLRVLRSRCELAEPTP